MEFKSCYDILKERAAEAGILLLDDQPISGQVFEDLNLPMVVACTRCEARLVFTRGFVDPSDPEGFIYCPGCIEESNHNLPLIDELCKALEECLKTLESQAVLNLIAHKERWALREAVQLKSELARKALRRAQRELRSHASDRDHFEAIRAFIPNHQHPLLIEGIAEYGDELRQLRAFIESMPTSYQQDGQGDKAIAFLHYFSSGSDWWITERDIGAEDDSPEDFQRQAFGLTILNGGEPELGYISIRELCESKRVEIDLYFTPKNLGQIKEEKARR